MKSSRSVLLVNVDPVDRLRKHTLMFTNSRNRQIEILAWSIFLNGLRVFRQVRDLPGQIFQVIHRRFQILAPGRALLLSAFGMLLGFSAGILIVWLIFDSGMNLR
jgi:hypothetical protein